jgi:hypothetical protein
VARCPGGAPATNRTHEEARKRGRRGPTSCSSRREASVVVCRRGEAAERRCDRELELGEGGGAARVAAKAMAAASQVEGRSRGS